MKKTEQKPDTLSDVGRMASHLIFVGSAGRNPQRDNPAKYWTIGDHKIGSRYNRYTCVPVITSF